MTTAKQIRWSYSALKVLAMSAVLIHLGVAPLARSGAFDCFKAVAAVWRVAEKVALESHGPSTKVSSAKGSEVDGEMAWPE